MAYSNRFRSMFNDNFKILTWVLILFIAITPNFIFMNSANAALAGTGWTLGDRIAQGASTVVNGTKNVIIDGKNYIKTGTAKITPVAGDVAKVLARGVGGLALSVAVEQLLGAVDWVLDPANNRITYYEADANPPINDPTKIDGYKVSSALVGNPYKGVVFTDKTTLGEYICEGNQDLAGSGGGIWTFKEIQISDGFEYVVCNPHGTRYVIETVLNPSYDPNAVTEREEKYLPLDVVAEQVITNANSGDTNAQVVTLAAAADIIAEAETDSTKARPIASQLDATASTKPADADAAAAAGEATATATPQADPVTGEQAPPTDIALKFPVFCDWVPVVCEAAQSAVNFMADYDPLAESGEVQVNQYDNIIFDDSQRITFSSGCPAPEQFSVSFFGATQNLEFSYAPLCDFMSMIRPFVIAGSYLIGAYIVMGLSRGSAE